MSRGDRRVGNAIYKAWQSGCRFDSWSEHFDFDKWQEALDECGIDPDFYACRQRLFDEVLPWSHIDMGISVDFLRVEYERAIDEEETPDCNGGACLDCGLQDWATECEDR